MRTLIAFVIALVMLVPLSGWADNNILKSTNFETGGYLVSVQETRATIKVQVRSTSPYGVLLQYSQSKMSHPDFKNIQYLTVAFDVAPTLQVQQGVKASDTYTRVMRKQNLDKVFLTLRTGSFDVMTEQEIWTRPVQPEAAAAEPETPMQ